MQDTSSKNLHLTKCVAEIIRQTRLKQTGLSVTKFAESYGIDKSKVLRAEKAQVHSQLITIWQIANALGMKCSELIALVEEQLGEDFTLIDE